MLDWLNLSFDEYAIPATGTADPALSQEIRENNTSQPAILRE